MRMDIGDRIKALRRELGYSQAKFGEILGLSRDAVNNLENGRLKRPEQKEPIYKLICQRFGVAEGWLRNGDAPMWADKNSMGETPALNQLASEQNLTRKERILIEKFLELKPEARKALIAYIERVAAALEDTPSAAGSVDEGVDVEAEIASYRAELEAEREAEAKSVASPDTADSTENRRQA